MSQNALTVTLKVKAGQGDTLRALLCEIGSDIRGNQYIRFADLHTIHFSRFVMLDNYTRVLFTTTHDGPVDEHLQEFIDKAPLAVETIFGKCEGFPVTTGADFARDFKQWIGDNSTPANVFFKAYPGQSVNAVYDTIDLREKIEALLNTPQAEPLVALIAQYPIIPPKPNPILTAVSGVVGTVLGKIVPLILSFIGPKISQERTTEASEKVHALDNDSLYSLTERESIVQNELTIISKIRPELLPNLKNVLRLLEFGCELPGGDGTLSGVSTIHFARWVIIDGGTNLLFESNYDGIWESYIGEFIDRAYTGLDAIWGCCEKYPVRGARDAQAFKQSIIDHQIRAEVFYSAYPHNSVKNILNDLAIGQMIRKVLNTQAGEEFFRRL
ncbi:MAG: hypothetical protein ABI947_18735 [Chloroflexota bacterium]